MAGRHARPPDPTAPAVAPSRVPDRRLILGVGLLALAALLAYVVIHFHVFGGGDEPTIGDLASSPTAGKTVKSGASPTGSSVPPTSPTATATTPSVSPSTKPSVSPKPSVTPTKPAPSPSPTKPAPKPTATKPPAPAPAPAPRYPLLVLNNSSISGLGSAAAADFEAGGWTIAGVGNLTGRLKDTTVYYDPGYEASARAFAAQFPQVHRVLARIPGLPGRAKLTVVVTRYYEPGGGK